MRSCPIPIAFLLLPLQPWHDVSDVVQDLVEARLGDNVQLGDLGDERGIEIVSIYSL